MKRLLAFLVSLLLVLPSAAFAEFRLEILSDEDLLALAQEVILELASRQMNVSPSGNPPSSSSSAPKELTGERVEMIRSHEEKYLGPDGSWHFPFTIENTTSTDLFIRSLTFLDNGDPNGDHRTVDSDPFLFEAMMGPDFKNTPLRPGDTMFFQDNHPGEYLTSRIYLFTFAGADGKEYTAEYGYTLLMETEDGSEISTPVNYAEDQGQDLLTLRHEADFSLEVADGVFWVPAASLGKSRFSNAEILRFVPESAETKQQEMNTLYEALQLYQISGFVSSDDNVRISENGVNWEHHKPGYHAVVTNNGCCATSANWLNYILKDDYEEVGFVATSQRDGSGHIFNYIFHDGWYYFIDLTHYRTDWVATAEETGDLNDYYATDFVLGNLHKAASVEAYVGYIQNTFNDPPGMMFQYMAPDCLAIDGLRDGSSVTIVYEDHPDVELHVIFDDPSDQMTHQLLPQPEKRPDWN